MITIGEFVSSLRNSLKATNQEAFLTSRFIYAMGMKHARWLTTRKDSSNAMGKFSSVVQTLELVNLEEVDAVRTLKIPVASGKIWIKSKDPLPAMFVGISGPLIKEVVTIDFSTRFRLTDLATYRRIAKSRRKAYMPDPYAIFEGGYLYFSENCLDGVAITAAFEQDISHLNNPELACIPMMDRKFPIPGKIQAEIESHMKQSDLAPLLNIPEDPQEDNKNLART
jgi:hypothetical protein